MRQRYPTPEASRPLSLSEQAMPFPTAAEVAREFWRLMATNLVEPLK